MRAVIIYGPPGAGKGTQANLIALSNNFIHFDTGRYLESLFADEVKVKKSKILQREKKLFDSGMLMTPSFVLNIVKQRTMEIAHGGFNIVYSGSPRTSYEAFGDKQTPGLINVLEETYGKKNIFVFLLRTMPRTSIQRNSRRLICAVCGWPAITTISKKMPKYCPLCLGSFRRRSLDKPEVIKVRLEQYRQRTWPIIKELKRRGYAIHMLNGEKKPFYAFNALNKILNKKSHVNF